MPALRRHIITADPILFAPERAGRPNAFGGEENGVCPFCPGNETMTPPEIERAGEPWRIRVFPNHLHSQLMPLPFVPPRVERERAAFGSGAKCPLCLEIGRHRDEGLVIEESGGFVRLAPSGSSHAYEQWIVPLRHQAEISAMDDGEVAGLGTALQRAARAAGSVWRWRDSSWVPARLLT